ncbi:MAG: 1,6-anhydro-N-acetylmuramyl-L-alanine amidase AmpD [Halioglobus sp.]|nr:1,6-anhydro-N-acetylmuramyl-L-alanine amidase AmpD [Halioglobus sp.]
MQYTLEQGWLREARRVLSPNCEVRPSGCTPELLVIHNISLPPGCYGGDSIERFFTNRLDWNEHPFFEEIRDMQVSAHLLIQRDGGLVQFVNFSARAWHAGHSTYKERSDCNDFSIGVELEGTDDDPYTDAQYAALLGVTNALIAQYPAMGLDKIVGHCDIAPGRKTDPGAVFDWQRYRQQLQATGRR